MSREYVKYQGNKFFFHPYHKDYLASKNGNILSIKWNKKKILKLCLNNHGYFFFGLYENNKRRNYYIHRFVYECFKGVIPKEMVIDHCDNDSKNNSISNLQLLSPKENQHKSNCKKVISYNLETQEKKIFNSLKEAGDYFNIIYPSVFKCCQKIIKTCKSKKDGKKYKFSYL